MNKGTFIGFISSNIKGEDITLRSGDIMRKVGFNIGCNRKSKDGGTDFPRVIAFGKTAEVIEKYFAKGKGIIVDFHIQTNSYTNKDGKKIYQTDIICDAVEFPPVRKEDIQAENSNEEHQEEVRDDRPTAPEEFMDIPDNVDDSLPFRK